MVVGMLKTSTFVGIIITLCQYTKLYAIYLAGKG